MKLFRPVFKSVWSYKEVKILLGFSCFPLLHALMTVFSPDFITIDTIGNYKTTFFDYFSLMMTVLYNIAAPGIVLTFLVAKVFKVDFEQRIYTLYKDLDRQHIFLTKMLSLILLVFLFFGTSLVTSAIAFYTKIGYMEKSSLALFGSDWQVSLVSVFGFLAMFLVMTSLSSVVALKKSGGAAMMTTIILLLAGTILSFVDKVNLLIPVSYKDLIESIGFVPSLFGAIALGLIYFAFFSSISLNDFKKMEF